MRKSLFTLLIILLGTMGYCTEKVYMDKQGVIRWTESREEVALPIIACLLLAIFVQQIMWAAIESK